MSYFCVRLLLWVGVCEYGPDVLFVHQGNVFFGLAERCVGECSEDIEVGFSVSVYVVCICLKRHSIVLCLSECGGRIGVLSSVIVGCMLYLLAQRLFMMSVDFEGETFILFE